MRPNIPNQKKAYDALNRRLVNYVAQVQSIYDRIAIQVATAIDGVGYDGSAEFLFEDYPELKQTINGIMTSYAAQMNNLIYAGTTNEWKESNIMQDLLARKVLRAYDFEKGGDKYNRYFQPNSDALKAFQNSFVDIPEFVPFLIFGEINLVDDIDDLTEEDAVLHVIIGIFEDVPDDSLFQRGFRGYLKILKRWEKAVVD